MANILTATANGTYAHVLLRTEFSATASATATVERSIDGGVTWTAVRGGDPLTLIGPAPAAGNRIGYLYDDEAPLNTSLLYRSTDNLGTVTTAGPVTIVVAADESWLKDPARPWANVKISRCVQTPVDAACTPAASEPAVVLVRDGLGAEVYAGDFTLFPVLNRPRPADVFAYRKDAVTSWQIASLTLASKYTLDTFWAWGGPVFIQLPPEYGWPDRYYQPGDVEARRLSGILSKPQRLWPTPLTVIDSFPGAAQGEVENNWCAVMAQYPTWGDLTTTGLTWGDVVAGAAVATGTEGYGLGPYGSGPYGDGG
jgi:hypothetical protein